MQTLPSSFSLEFRVDLLGTPPGELLALGDSLRVILREAGTEAALEKWDRIDQNYLQYPLPEGRCLVLEVIARYDTADPARATQRIGVPLALLPQAASSGMHHITVRRSVAHLQLLVDGQLMDEEWPVSLPLPFAGEPTLSAAVADLQLRDEVPPVAEGPLPQPTSLQYFSPPGHNVWAGDTMCVVYQERFHLFYLLDRRHGASKFGCGAHQIAHASSADLRTWEHHPMALPIREEDWLTCGTGVPLVRDGKLLLFYGMHTDRVVPHDQTITPQLKQQFERDGVTQPVPFFADGKYPMGSAIATSDDGLTFTPGTEVIHLCQNPSPFQDPATGQVYLLAGYHDHGLYVGDESLRHWTLVDRHFLPDDKMTPQGNTLECQCHFEWNGWYYLIAGRTGFWMSRKFLGPFWAGAKDGQSAPIYRPRWDIYDGLWVPMVVSWPGNRRILAGWMTGPDFDYAGYLVFRELIQHEDGTLGTKWPAEMIPASGEELRPRTPLRVEAGTGSVLADGGIVPPRCHLSLKINPTPGTECFGLRFGMAELKFSPRLQRVQWAPAPSPSPSPAADLPTLEEILDVEPYIPIWRNPHPNLPVRGGDFVLQHVEGLDRPFTLELIVLYDPKSHSTLIDLCIDGRRTMITRRPGLRVSDLKLFVQNGAATFVSSVRPLT